jgi:DNA-binding NtrC family response regulator
MVFPIRLPPLRERGEDVLLLAEHFVALFSERLGRAPAPLRADVREAILAYDFPGNVRELRNVIERAVILAGGGELTLETLPERVLEAPARCEPARSDLPVLTDGSPDSLRLSFKPGRDTLESVEKSLIEEALRRTGGNKARAAGLLGISRFALMRRLAKDSPDE